MVVTKIEDDGCLRVFKNGGVDPRILPGMEVAVQARSGPIYGVVGAKPPHLLTEKEREKAISIQDVYIDTGYPVEQVRNLVRVGDMAVLLSKSANNRRKLHGRKTWTTGERRSMLLSRNG